MLAVWVGCLLAWGGLCASGCKGRPSAVERRLAEIRERDSLELVEAMAELAAADSVATFRALELADVREGFVLEKQERFQTVGYYVLPAYQGSKARLACFPEVEEGGALLLVSVDAQRRYTFTELPLEDGDDAAQVPDGLPEALRTDIARCRALAVAMRADREARAQREKLAVKVRFYERKLARDREKAAARGRNTAGE